MWPAVPRTTFAIAGAGALDAEAIGRSRASGASARRARELGQVEDALAAAAAHDLAGAVHPGEVVGRDAHLAAAAHLVALDRDDRLALARLEDALVDREGAGRQRLRVLVALRGQLLELGLVL